MSIEQPLGNPIGQPTNTQIPSQTEQEDLTMLLENPDGSVDVQMSENDLNEALEGLEEESAEFYDNLVTDLDEETLQEIAQDVVSSYESDEESRSEWMNTIKEGMDILGIGIKTTSEPFEGACAASHPLILESVIKFQAKAGSELLPAGGPVKTQVLGAITPEKEQQATRVREHMNWQVTTQMTEYYPDKERMLFYLPLIGSAFTKTYWNASEGRPVSEFVSVDNFVISNDCTDLERARRYTHIIPKTYNDLKEDIASGLYEDKLDEMGQAGQTNIGLIAQKVNSLMGTTSSQNVESDQVYVLLEQHVSRYIPELDKDEYELPKPYIITVDKDSQKVLGIRRNWKEEDTKFKKKVAFTHYPFVPSLGFYGLGYTHLLGNLQTTLTSSLRALLDAAQFANLPAGFKTKSIRMPKDQGPLKFGEWRDIEAAGVKLSEAFMPLPYKEPSAVLFNMLQYLEGRSQQFADSTEAVVADSTNYGPVGTTMALLDASTKFFAAAHRRLHYSQKRELQTLAEINSEYIETETDYNVVGGVQKIYRADYDNATIEILPVSDPNVSSNAHRITLETTKAQMVQQLGAQSSVNMKEMLKRMFLALGEKEIDKIIPPDEEAKPQDPVSDIMAAVQGKPIKAFQGQNHDAHMQVKAAWLEDPANGASPIMSNVGPILQANIREHMMVKYQETIAGAMQNVQTTGAATDPTSVEMVIAEAAKMVAENNRVAAERAAEGTPDQMIAKAEMLKAQTQSAELEHKKKKDFASAAVDVAKINIEAIKEANRHAEAAEELKAGITKETMRQGKDLALTAVKNLSDGEKHMSTLEAQANKARGS